MSVNSGASITAAFYNSIQTTVANTLGPSSGDAGYGQTVTSSQVAPNTPITTAQWNNLINDLNKCYQHQNNVGNYISQVRTVMLASTLNTCETTANNNYNSRVTANGSNLTLTANALTLSRTGAWSSNITAVATIQWSSQDAARYFFNTGGNVQVALAQPSSAQAQDQSWNSVLSSIGTIAIGWRNSTRSGTLGTAQNIGYFNLTTSDQLVFNGTDVGSGAYATNDVLVYARTNASFNQVIVTVTLQDQHTNSFYDSVSSGATATFAHLKSTVICTGIESPTFTATQQFSGS